MTEVKVGWATVRRFCLRRIKEQTRALCSTSLDQGRTQVLRGRIEAYRRVLELERDEALGIIRGGTDGREVQSG